MAWEFCSTMNLLRNALLFGLSTLVMAGLTPFLRGQGVTETILQHPPSDSWPGYHGDYSCRRHTALSQITPENVKNLSLAWAFQTNQASLIKSSPLLVDGI